MFRLERARPRNTDVDNLAHSRGARAENHNSIGKKHGFPNVMSDEQHRLARARPDLRHLKFFPRLGIYRGERLVEE